jgi:hypothetical protein
VASVIRPAVGTWHSTGNYAVAHPGKRVLRRGCHGVIRHARLLPYPTVLPESKGDLVNARTREPTAGVMRPQPWPPDMDWIYGLPWRDWLDLQARETAPREARRRLMDDLEKWSLSQFEVSATLVVSEIVTNAVAATNALAVAGEPPPVRLWLLGGPVVVALLAWDASTDPPVRRCAADTDESGRGLAIVEELSALWGYYYPAQAGGKVTWAIIDRP